MTVVALKKLQTDNVAACVAGVGCVGAYLPRHLPWMRMVRRKYSDLPVYSAVCVRIKLASKHGCHVFRVCPRLLLL